MVIPKTKNQILPVVILIIAGSFICFASYSFGATGATNAVKEGKYSGLERSIGLILKGARVKITQADSSKVISFLKRGDVDKIEAVSKKGEATIVRGEGESEERLTLHFDTFEKVLIAKNRIRPKTKLSADLFEIREINFSLAKNRRFFGHQLHPGTNLQDIESNQTILKGHFPLKSAVNEVPIIRSGEVIQLRVTSGNIVVMTQGRAQEPGRKNEGIRVQTLGTKKMLLGKVKQSGLVEVQL